MTPIDILATAVAKAGWAPSTQEAAPLAAVAAETLIDERIVTQVAQALRDDSGTAGISDVVRHLDAEARRQVARVALRSIGGA